MTDLDAELRRIGSRVRWRVAPADPAIAAWAAGLDEEQRHRFEERVGIRVDAGWSRERAEAMTWGEMRDE